MVTKHNQTSVPISLVDITDELILLTKNILTKNEILAMTIEAE